MQNTICILYFMFVCVCVFLKIQQCRFHVDVMLHNLWTGGVIPQFHGIYHLYINVTVKTYESMFIKSKVKNILWFDKFTGYSTHRNLYAEEERLKPLIIFHSLFIERERYIKNKSFRSKTSNQLMSEKKSGFNTTTS